MYKCLSQPLQKHLLFGNGLEKTDALHMLLGTNKFVQGWKEFMVGRCH